MPKRIKIRKGLPNGTLDLSDGGHSNVKKGKTIVWKIRDASGPGSIKVDSFKIEIKSDPSDIFSTKPFQDGRKWKAVIDKHAPVNAECKYSIHWKEKDGPWREHDPKISIIPTGTFFQLLFALIMSLFGLLTLQFLLKGNKKN